jgi:hypothetical protein
MRIIVSDFFLSDGYPLQYINNGTVSIFAAGYDWFNDFYGIANFNTSPLVYRAASNENLGPGTIVQSTGVSVIVCQDPLTSNPALTTTPTCPTFFGAANRSISISKELRSNFSLFPNPNHGSFNLRCISCGSIHSVEIYNTLGEQVANLVFSETKADQVIDLSSYDLPNGVYSIKVIGSDYIERSSFVLKR